MQSAGSRTGEQNLAWSISANEAKDRIFLIERLSQPEEEGRRTVVKEGEEFNKTEKKKKT